MCTTHMYVYVYPDGRREQTRRPALCNASRHGQPCRDNIKLQHPIQFVQSYGMASQLPPTPPPYTPPRSLTPIHHHSHRSRSGSSSAASSRSRYSSASRPLEPAHQPRDRRHYNPPPRRDRDRIVVVDGPPTPPQIFAAPHSPHSPPSSPRAAASVPYQMAPPPAPRRPVIVDERRARIQTEAHAPRHSSTSSSRTSAHANAAEEEQLRRRRRERETVRQERDKEARAQRIRQRIAEANAEIAGRVAVPMAEPAAPRRAPRPTTMDDRTEEELVDAVRRLDIEEKRLEHRLRRRRRPGSRDEADEADEAQAQRVRLMERMVPARAGPGSRRHRVLYDDGIYRRE